jgi:hypothetical protein
MTEGRLGDLGQLQDFRPKDLRKILPEKPKWTRTDYGSAETAFCLPDGSTVSIEELYLHDLVETRVTLIQEILGEREYIRRLETSHRINEDIFPQAIFRWLDGSNVLTTEKPNNYIQVTKRQVTTGEFLNIFLPNEKELPEEHCNITLGISRDRLATWLPNHTTYPPEYLANTVYTTEGKLLSVEWYPFSLLNGKMKLGMHPLQSLKYRFQDSQEGWDISMSDWGKEFNISFPRQVLEVERSETVGRSRKTLELEWSDSTKQYQIRIPYEIPILQIKEICETFPGNLRDLENPDITENLPAMQAVSIHSETKMRYDI